MDICNIIKLVKCINCKSIICDNYVNYKTHITDPNSPNISRYICIKCKDNVNPSIKKPSK